MSTDLPGDRGPGRARGTGPGAGDAGLQALLRALTAEPGPAELAAERETLAMFRANFGRGSQAAGVVSAPSAAGAAVPGSAAATDPAAATEPAAPPSSAGRPDGPGGPGRPGGPGGPGRYRGAIPGSAAGGLAPGRLRRAWPARGTPRRVRLAATAIAALVVAGPVAAAYAAALPPPVQRFAHQWLGFAGVPDAGRQTERPEAGGASPSPTPRPVSSRPSAPPSSSGRPGNSSPSATPGRSKPARSATPPPAPPVRLAIEAEPGQIAAGGTAALSGRVTRGGRPLAGVVVRLLERPAGATAWTAAGHGTTSADGRVMIDVSQVTRNAAFRLTGPSGVTSQAVAVTVVPAVTVQVVPLRLGREALVASAPLAQPGDLALLQVEAGGEWVTERVHHLGGHGRTAFVVRVRRRTRSFRVLLPATGLHAASASGPVTG